MRLLMTIGIAVVASVMLPAGVLAVPATATYTKIKLKHATGTHVSVINNTGAVAGQDDGFEGPAFIKTADGKVTRFAVDGAFVTIPRGLTDTGAVGGRYDLPDDTTHGFLRDATGALTPFDGPGLGAAEIDGMNAGNDIAGTYFVDQNQNLDGFIRHTDGSFTSFHIDDVYPDELHLAGINAKGEIAGDYVDTSFASHGFLRAANGRITTFDPPAGEGITVAAMNDRGWVAGFLSRKGALQGYVRKRNGDTETFEAPGAFIAITAMNHSGAVTGCYASNFHNYGFIRAAGGKVTGFHLPWGPSENMCPQSVNDAGQVAGYVHYGSFGEKEFGFIRTP
jgi:hypothetical protein